MMEKNPPYQEKQREAQTRWRKAHREYFIAYYALHKEKLRKYGRDYWHANKKRMLAQQKEYKAKKQGGLL